MLGKISFDPREPMALPIIEQMLAAAADAPDAGRGIYCAPGIALGWMDRERPRAGGRDGATRVVVADADITNGAALATELQRLGRAMRDAAADTLILHAYQQWGARAFARLRGPFACAIWDATARRLVLARDQLGLRPLYFAVLPDHGVVFATHLRALLRDPGVAREWCPAAIDAYLTVGYVPAPLTPYRRISKLEPGHLLVIEGRRLHVERYWDLPAATTRAGAEGDVLRRIGERLREVVHEQRAGGDSNGVLYSGGTASTTLLSLAPQGWSRAVTVTADQDGSEVVRSGRAASLLGRSRDLDTRTPDFAALARELAAGCDEPVGDPAAVSQFAICLGARRYVDCALAAHGAATLWADHARHRVERVEAAARAWLARPLASVGAEIGRSLQDTVRGARALSHLALPPADACAVKHAYGFWDDAWRRTLYTRGFAWEVRECNPLARHLELYASRDTADPLDRALYVDALTFLPDSVLTVADCTARAAGLRLRLPMVDPDMVAAVAALPSGVKRRGAAGMYALRALLTRELPPGLLPPARRVPARHAWLAPALRALVPSVLLAPRFDGRGIVSRPALRRLWNEHRRGRRDHAHRLWSLLMLEFWFRNAIDGNAADVPVEYAVVKAA